MKNMVSINDMLAFKNSYDKLEFEIKDDSLIGELKSNGIEIIPSVDPKNGNYGCIIYKNVGNSEKKIEIYNKVLEPIAKTILEESFDDFVKHFDEYRAKDIYVFELNDPKILRLGYVAVCGSGLIYHQIRISEYKTGNRRKKMIKYKEEIKKEKIATSVICDVCKKEYSFEKDFLQTQEFHYVRFTGGYASVFGDDRRIECDICQHCLKKLIGEYCREENE